MKLRHVPQLVLLALVVLFVTLALCRAWSTITWQRREIGRMREHLVILETDLSQWRVAPNPGNVLQAPRGPKNNNGRFVNGKEPHHAKKD